MRDKRPRACTRLRGRAARAARGTFVAPTLIELDSLAELQREVFGPVLHVVRYRREELDGLIERSTRPATA